MTIIETSAEKIREDLKTNGISVKSFNNIKDFRISADLNVKEYIEILMSSGAVYFENDVYRRSKFTKSTNYRGYARYHYLDKSMNFRHYIATKTEEIHFGSSKEYAIKEVEAYTRIFLRQSKEYDNDRVLETVFIIQEKIEEDEVYTRDFENKEE